MKKIARAASLLLAAACAAAGTQAALPTAWHEPLPHGGELTALAGWWGQFDDPLLSRLIDAAQAANPDIASAAARIAQARASAAAAGASLLPSAEATLGVSRSRTDAGQPVATRATSGLQLSWELDLFGGVRAGARAAGLRLDAARAGWHEARVSVAAETASRYVTLRACEARLVHTEIDAASREETSRLTAATAANGMQSAGNAALARASAAQGRANATLLRAQCASHVKALVALTALDEPALRADLAASWGKLPQPAHFGVETVPARALAQRPDLHAAVRDMEAASQEWAQTRAHQWPRITLQGQLGAARTEAGALRQDGGVWSFGPVSVVLPVFDAGTRQARSEAARARYDEAVATLQWRTRTAVREVEDALVALQSTAGRAADSRIAADGFGVAYQATGARYRGGMASLFELEEARRRHAQAQIELTDLQQERVQAWITLYRALGGGWTPAEPTASLTLTPESTP